MIQKLLVLLSLIFAFGIIAEAQTVQTTQNASELLTRLPDSEAVMFIDPKRLFSDARLLLTVNDPAQFAEINRQIERFKQQTGIDAKDFDVMGFAGIVPKYVSSRIKFGTPELSRPFRELRGFYGSIETDSEYFLFY